MSLAKHYPNAVVDNGIVYFIDNKAFGNLPENTIVDLECNERISAPVKVIEGQLNQIIMLDVGDVDIDTNKISVNIVNLLSDIPLEDKARLVYCASLAGDNNELVRDFRRFWTCNQARIYKNTTVRFIKEGVAVMEMKV
jgi:hypothetical protein